MEDEDYEIDYDNECPKCKHSPIHSRECNNFCQNGYFDASDDDPINYIPGEEYEMCPECLGTGYEVWCPSCGANLSRYKFPDTDYDLPMNWEPDYNAPDKAERQHRQAEAKKLK